MIYSKIFWGVLIILFGASIIFNAVFKFNFPFFKVFIALIIIFFGFRMLFGSFGIHQKINKSEHSSIFSANKVKLESLDDDVEFNSVFGSQEIDLSNLVVANNSSEIELNAVFGSIKLILPKDVNVKLKANSAFGSVRLPDGEEVNFGDVRKTIDRDLNSDKMISIEVNAVFGSAHIY